MPVQTYDKFPYTIEALQWLNTSVNRTEMEEFVGQSLEFPDALMALNDIDHVAENAPVPSEFASIIMIPVSNVGGQTGKLPCTLNSWVVKENDTITVYSEQLFNDLIKNSASQKVEEIVQQDRDATETAEKFIADTSAQITELETQVNSINNSNSVLQEKSQSNENSIGSINQRISTLESTLGTNNSNTLSNTDNIAENTDNIAELDTRVSTLEASMIMLQNAQPPVTGFRVFRTTAQGLTADVETRINFNAQSFNRGNHFNLTTDEYVTPVQGYYEFYAHIMITAGTVGQRIISRIRVSALATLAQTYHYQGSTSFHTHTIRTEAFLAANTTVYLTVIPANTNVNFHNGSLNSYFTGKFLYY